MSSGDTLAQPALQGIGQTLLGMAAVLALILALAWLARRFGVRGAGRSHLLKVVASTAIGQRERVVVVEVAGTWVVLGVTPTHVQALHTLPAPPAHAGAAAGAA